MSSQNLTKAVKSATGSNAELNGKPKLTKQQIKTRHIMEHVMAGFPCFPLNNDRTPQVKGWNKLTPDPLFTDEDFPYGYGITLPETILVVDYDPRRDENRGTANNELKRLWDTCMLQKTADYPTYVVNTPRGGVHIYFRCPPNMRFKSMKKLSDEGWKAIEFKSKGQYVIGPGSPHNEAAKRYTVGLNDIRNIADAEKGLLDFAEYVPARDDHGLAEYQDDDITQGYFIRICKDEKPAIETLGGDLQTFYIACRGKDMGLSPQINFNIMAKHFNPRCVPPWDLEELKVKVANAYQHGKNAVGSSNPSSDFANVTLEEVAEAHLPPKDRAFNWDTNKRGDLNPSMANVNHLIRMARYGHMYWNTDARQMVLDKTKPQYPNELLDLFTYNLFTHKVEYTKTPPWHGEDDDYSRVFEGAEINLFKGWLGDNRPIHPNKYTLIESARYCGYERAYHPLRDWLNSLEWDGTPRVDTLFSRYAGTVDSPYTRAVAMCTLIGAVARAFEPGCQFHYMPVLEGAQRTGKSTFIRTLSGKYYGRVKIDPSTMGLRDTVTNMRGKWIMESTELDQVTRKADVGALKGFLDTASDTVTLKYEAGSEDIPRQGIFIGTVNPGEAGYLKDRTGNSRFWCLTTSNTDIDIPGLQNARDQLFAEAVHRYKQGEKWHMDRDMEAIAMHEANKRLELDIWDDIVATYLEKNDDAATTEQIGYRALNLSPSQLDQASTRRLVYAIKAAGYESKIVYSKETKKNARCWVKQSEEDNWI